MMFFANGTWSCGTNDKPIGKRMYLWIIWAALPENLLPRTATKEHYLALEYACRIRADG